MDLCISILKLHKPCQEQIFFHHSMKFGSCIPHNFFRMYRKLFKTFPPPIFTSRENWVSGRSFEDRVKFPKKFYYYQSGASHHHLPPTNHTAENNFLDSSYNCSMPWTAGIRPQREGKFKLFFLSDRAKTPDHDVDSSSCSTQATKAIVIDWIISLYVFCFKKF